MFLELYHITEKKNVDRILQEGLIPRIDPRSKGVEPEPLICLTEEAYIPMWKILLGIRSPKILKISTNFSSFSKTAYTDYEEYVIREPILPAYIELADISVSRRTRHEAMETLCRSRIYTLSDLCVTCAQHYTYKKENTYNQLESWIRSECRILRRLDYSVLSAEEKKQLLKNFGESGEYTFLDTYKNTDKKLYQLSMYDDPYTYNIRRYFEDIITEKFNDCLDLNTGGWGT